MKQGLDETWLEKYANKAKNQDWGLKEDGKEKT